MHNNNTARLIRQLIYMVEDHVSDNSSMTELLDCLEDNEFGTQRSRNIFSTIRAKSLKAERLDDNDLRVQRSFEEACAKTIYNLGRPTGAYDPDAQFWIIPLAFQLAKQLDLPEDIIMDLMENNLKHIA